MHHPCTLSVQVLDELDIMLKVWKKRTEHVFTAHIQKGGEDKAAEDASGDDSSMRYSAVVTKGFNPPPQHLGDTAVSTPIYSIKLLVLELIWL